MLSQNKTVLRGLLVGSAGVLYLLEGIVLVPIPWFRIGFSHIPVILALLWLDFPSAVGVSLLRVILGGCFTVGIGGPGFYLGIVGALASVVVMGLMVYFGRGIFGVIGISIAGAVSHNLLQVFTAELLFLPDGAFRSLAFLFVLLGGVSGALVGWISWVIVSRVNYGGV